MPTPIVASTPRDDTLPRLEQSLEVAIRPLPKRAVIAHDPARVESLTKIYNESPPFFVRELSIEIDGVPDANRKSKECA